MKEQVSKIIWRAYGADGNITEMLILRDRCMEQKIGETIKTLVMEEARLDALLDEICALIAADTPQETDTAPAEAVIWMKDDTKYFVPAEKLAPLMQKAWEDTCAYAENMKTLFSRMDVQGLVSCPTEPPVPMPEFVQTKSAGTPEKMSPQERTQFMQQIREVVYCGGDDYFYTANLLPDSDASRITRIRLEDGSRKTLPVEDELHDCFCEELCDLAEQNPNCPQPQGKLRSEIRLDDGSLRCVPVKELGSVIEDMWSAANMMLEMMCGPQLQGAVVCQTLPPVSPVNTPVNGFMEMFMQNGMGMGMMQQPAPKQKPVRIDKDTWNCGCGQEHLTGKFCPECGAAAPPPLLPWDCPNCGAKALNSPFCPECGTKRPAVWDCPNCGNAGNTGKFCPECGAARQE